MATLILMPQAGQSMTEGKIIRWIAEEGKAVQRGDPILEIETDKANMEVEAPADGVIRKILQPEGVVVPVLTPVAVLAAASEAFNLESLMQAAALAAATAPAATPAPAAAPVQAPGPKIAAAAPPAPKAPTAPAAARPAAPQIRTSAASPAGKIAASPLARRLAAREGMNLRNIRGTGPRGRIIRRDVEAAAKVRPRGRSAVPGLSTDLRGEYPPPAPRPPERVPLAGMRKAIATALQRSKVQAPHFYATVEIDITEALDIRRRKEAEGLKVSVNDMVVRACALALRDEPRVNCRVSDEAVEYPADVNIGIAVGLDNGLVVPVILRAQDRSLEDMAAEGRRIIEAARGGKLVGMGQGTFTISNLGMYGIKCFTAVINPPEGAILAVGRASERAVPAAGGFLTRTIIEATLSADHRAIDGLLAARFLDRLRRLLQEPERIF